MKNSHRTKRHQKSEASRNPKEDSKEREWKTFQKPKGATLCSPEEKEESEAEGSRKTPERSSKKEHRADALALRADERRDKLRKAAGRSKYPKSRGYLNGETRMRSPHASMRQSITHGGEPGELKHLSSRRKRKKDRFSE